MDAADRQKRLGAENVHVYRRSEKELPARLEEIHHAKEEGIEFRFLSNPVRILGDDSGYVKGMECIRMELGEPDASGRRRPVPVPGSEFVLEVGTVIVAIGQSPNPLIKKTVPELKTHSWGGIITDEKTGETNIPTYSQGKIGKERTVILAMEPAKMRNPIDEYLSIKRN